MGERRVNNEKYWILLIFFIPLFLYGCCSSSNSFPNGPGKDEYIVSATLYNQLSGEYRALALQTYNLAKLRLDDKLRDTTLRNLHLAIITDLDETALDNSKFQGQLVKDNSTYMQEWNSYVSMSIADSVPGSVAFFNYVNTCNLKYHLKNKIQIFYITNRDSLQFKATAINLARLHFPQIDSINFKNDSNLLVERTNIDGPKASNKEYRFKLVKRNYSVLLQLGDNLNDFSGDFYHLSDSARKSKVDSLERLDEIGNSYIAFPNAMYGDWIIPGLPKKDNDPAISRRKDLSGYK